MVLLVLKILDWQLSTFSTCTSFN